MTKYSTNNFTRSPVFGTDRDWVEVYPTETEQLKELMGAFEDLGIAVSEAEYTDESTHGDYFLTRFYIPSLDVEFLISRETLRDWAESSGDTQTLRDDLRRGEYE